MTFICLDPPLRRAGHRVRHAAPRMHRWPVGENGQSRHPRGLREAPNQPGRKERSWFSETARPRDLKTFLHGGPEQETQGGQPTLHTAEAGTEGAGSATDKVRRPAARLLRDPRQETRRPLPRETGGRAATAPDTRQGPPREGRA